MTTASGSVRDDRLVRLRDAVLCDAERTPRPAEQRCEAGANHYHKIAAHAAVGKGHPGAQIRDNAMSKRASGIPLGKISLTSRARPVHRPRLSR